MAKWHWRLAMLIGPLPVANCQTGRERRDLFMNNNKTSSNDRRIKPMPFWEKYTLTVGEASSYFHIGEKKLREIIEENPTADFILMSGKRIMIKRTRFEQFLDRKNWI